MQTYSQFVRSIAMTDREKQILDIVHDVLRSGLSIDTYEDQEYVYKCIQDEVESRLEEQKA